MTRKGIIVTLLCLFLFPITQLNALFETGNDIEDENEGKRSPRQTITDEMVNAGVDPGPLVKYGNFCRPLPIDIPDSLPERSPPPVNYTIYYIDDSTPNTLHVVIQNTEKSYRYDYLVVMAMNEIGVPIGHFHLLVCALGAKRSGYWVLGTRCNKGKDHDRSIRKEFGNPHLMYVEKDPKKKQKLSIQSIFWSWIPRDGGPRPNMIQFRIAVVEKSKLRDKYWVITTPQIKFLEKWIFIPPLASEGIADLDNPLSDDKDDPEHCYENPLKADSPGNFQSTSLTEVIPANPKYMSEIFPLFYNNPSTDKRNKKIERIKTEIRNQMKRKDLDQGQAYCMSPPSMGSVIRSSKNHKEIYKGCSVVKNCIGETDSCVELKTCKSILTYRNMEFFFGFENYIRFELQVHLGQAHGYAAMGISTDEYMGDDSVVECSVDTTGKVGIYSSWNFNNKTNTRTGFNCTKEGVPGENLKLCKLALRKNVLACSFHLRKDLFVPEGVTINRKHFHLQKNTFYLFQASGTDFVEGASILALRRRITKGRRRIGKSKARMRPKRGLGNNTNFRGGPLKVPMSGRNLKEIERKNGSKSARKIAKKSAKKSGRKKGRKIARSKGRTLNFARGTLSGIAKHTRSFLSPNKLDLQELEIVDGEPAKLKYIKWHVAFVVVAFIGLIPNGVFVARYFKETWTAAMIFNTSIWRLVHKAYMISVIVLLLIDSIVLLCYQNKNDKDEIGTSTHRICGYVFYAVVIFIQPLLGLSTSCTKDTMNYIVRVMHWGIGTLVKVLGNIFIAFSPQMVDTRIFIGIWVICFLELLFNIIMHAVMTVMYHKGDAEMFKTRRDSHGRWNRAFNPLPMQKIHRAMPGQRRRFLLYLWFQFGTAVFASLIIIPYAGYNRLFVCKDEPLALHKITCQNPGKGRVVL